MQVGQFKQWFSAHFGRPFQWTFWIALAITSSGLSAAQTQQSCTPLQVREAYYHMLNGEPDAAQRILMQLKSQDQRFYLADFYLALSRWTKAHLAKDKPQQAAGLRALMASIDGLKERMRAQASDELELALTLAQAHVARIKFVNKQPLSALRLARTAKKRAGELFARYPDHPDLMLVLGLYEYHSGNVPHELNWLRSLFKLKGDTQLGLQWIQDAIAHSPSFAPEAARALLQEVNWRTPQLCGYAGLAEELSRKAPRNAALAISKQGLYLYCGHAELALTAQSGFLDLGVPVHPEQAQAMRDIRLRALSQLGRVDQLKALVDQTTLTPEMLEFAIAEAHDLSANRAQAVLIYERLIGRPEVAAIIRKLAKLRLSHAAVRRPKLALGRELGLASEPCNEYALMKKFMTD